MALSGQSILGPELLQGSGEIFFGWNPATGERLEPPFHSALIHDVDAAASLAEEAFPAYGKLSGRQKGIFLRHIAGGLQDISEELIERAHLETALPEKRLAGELARTTNQLRFFAEVVEEGSWSMARIDTADPERQPLPRPDIRSILQPLGPVAVFGASNFPLAFSVAGGDTASALAAGNPVIVKAHPAHPGTSELVGRVIHESVRNCGLPAGVFSLLFDVGIQVGTALVKHPLIKAVGFTGSLAGGKALMQLAASRPEPIPCFAEMGSSNPFFVLPEALRTQGETIAKGLFESFTLGLGQMCTKPGLVFLPRDRHGDAFVETLISRVAQAPSGVMLTAAICRNYQAAIDQRTHHDKVELLTQAPVEDVNDSSFRAAPVLLQVSGSDLLLHGDLAKEIFGPSALLVRYTDRNQLIDLAQSLEGHLTATIHGSDADIADYADLIAILERKVGRLIFGGYPTGVEVGHAMVHGGPYPTTSDGRSTSVGSQAILRFARPVCYQSFPHSALPEELKDDNPLGIWRLVNGAFTRDPLKSHKA